MILLSDDDLIIIKKYCRKGTTYTGLVKYICTNQDHHTYSFTFLFPAVMKIS